MFFFDKSKKKDELEIDEDSDSNSEVNSYKSDNTDDFDNLEHEEFPIVNNLWGFTTLSLSLLWRLLSFIIPWFLISYFQRRVFFLLKKSRISLEKMADFLTGTDWFKKLCSKSFHQMDEDDVQVLDFKQATLAIYRVHRKLTSTIAVSQLKPPRKSKILRCLRKVDFQDQHFITETEFLKITRYLFRGTCFKVILFLFLRISLMALFHFIVQFPIYKYFPDNHILSYSAASLTFLILLLC